MGPDIVGRESPLHRIYNPVILGIYDGMLVIVTLALVGVTIIGWWKGDLFAHWTGNALVVILGGLVLLLLALRFWAREGWVVHFSKHHVDPIHHVNDEMWFFLTRIPPDGNWTQAKKDQNWQWLEREKKARKS